MKSLTIRKADDWHIHLRSGEILNAVLPYSSQYFSRGMIMPNLIPPITTSEQAQKYYEDIKAHIPTGHYFEPCMSLYLTETTKWEDINEGFSQGFVTAVKLYPAGATTNSASGVKDITKISPLLEKMAEFNIPLLIHGEVVDDNIDIFDREAVFIEKILEPLRLAIPSLKITMEHITTSQAVQYVLSAQDNLAATITTHHLVINRNAYLAGGIRPHYYCLPVAKREEHRLALRKAAISGDKRFFLGTDTAPHLDHYKLQACGCAGMFTAPNTMAILAHIFEEEKALGKLEAFTSIYGAQYYNKPLNEQKIKLIKKDKPIDYPQSISTKEGNITVFDPGFDLFWQVEE